MLRLVSDEDVHDDIIRGLRRREPNLDILRVREVGLAQRPDPAILSWAADQGRILVTGDLNTMIGFAWNRVQAGEPIPGVMALVENAAIGRVIDDILLIAQMFAPGEINDQVVYIPL